MEERRFLDSIETSAYSDCDALWLYYSPDGLESNGTRKFLINCIGVPFLDSVVWNNDEYDNGHCRDSFDCGEGQETASYEEILSRLRGKGSTERHLGRVVKA